MRPKLPSAERLAPYLSVIDQARTRIDDLQQRIDELAGMRDALARLVDTCEQPRAERACPILRTIETAATTTMFTTQE